MPGFPSLPRLRRVIAGAGRVSEIAGGLRLEIAGTPKGRYSDAQIDDYGRLRRRDLPWRPPLAIRLRARASHPHPGGTLGFGLWNDPFAFSGGMATGQGFQLPAPPQCAWFFHGSAPNDFSLFTGDSAPGWKATVFRAQPSILSQFAGIAAVLGLPVALLLGLSRPALETARRWVGASTVDLGDPSVEREYRMEWRRSGVRFLVDETVAHETPLSPIGPLGFIAWIDNQYAVASAGGTYGYGVIPVQAPQWLDLMDLRIDPLAE